MTAGLFACLYAPRQQRYTEGQAEPTLVRATVIEPLLILGAAIFLFAALFATKTGARLRAQLSPPVVLRRFAASHELHKRREWLPWLWSGTPDQRHLVTLTYRAPTLEITIEAPPGSALALVEIQDKTLPALRWRQDPGVESGRSAQDERFEFFGPASTLLLAQRHFTDKLFASPSAPQQLFMRDGKLTARWIGFHEGITQEELQRWFSKAMYWFDQNSRMPEQLPARLLEAASLTRDPGYARRCGQTLLDDFPDSEEAARLSARYAEEADKANKAKREALDRQLTKQTKPSPAEQLRLLELALCERFKLTPSWPDLLPSTLRLTAPSQALAVELDATQDQLVVQVQLTLPIKLNARCEVMDQAPEALAIAAQRWQRLGDDPLVLKPARWRALFPQMSWASDDPLECALALKPAARDALAKLLDAYPQVSTTGHILADQLTLRCSFEAPKSYSTSPYKLWSKLLKDAATSLRRHSPGEEALQLRLTQALKDTTAQEQQLLLLLTSYDHDPALCAKLLGAAPKKLQAHPISLALRLHCGERWRLELAQLEQLLGVATAPREDGPTRRWALEAAFIAANQSDAQLKLAIKALNKTLLKLHDDDLRTTLIERAIEQLGAAAPPEARQLWRLLSAPPKLPTARELEQETGWDEQLGVALLEVASDEQREAILTRLPVCLGTPQAEPLIDALFELGASHELPEPSRAKIELLLLEHATLHEALPDFLLARHDAKRDAHAWSRALTAAAIARESYGDAHDEAWTRLYIKATHHTSFEVVRGAARALITMPKLDAVSCDALLSAAPMLSYDRLIEKLIARLEQEAPQAPQCFKAYAAALTLQLGQAQDQRRWLDRVLAHPYADKTPLWAALAMIAITAPQGEIGLRASALIFEEPSVGEEIQQRVLEHWASKHPVDETRIWAIEQLGRTAKEIALEELTYGRADEALKVRLVELLIAWDALHALGQALARALANARKQRLLEYITARFIQHRETALLKPLLQRLEEEQRPEAVALISDALKRAQHPQTQEALLKRLGATTPEIEQRRMEVLAEVGVARTAVPELLAYSARLKPLREAQRREVVEQTIARLQARVSEQAQLGLEVVSAESRAGGLSAASYEASQGALSIEDSSRG